MRVDTRWQKLIFPLMAIVIFGCSSGGGGDGTTPPEPHAPTVQITQHPPATINPDDDASFVWQGADQDGDLAGYFIKLDGAFQSTSDTSITYSNLTPGANYTFYVFAVDSGGLHSDTASWSFGVGEPPHVEIILHPSISIMPGDTAFFAWSGSDGDGNLMSYFAGLGGEFIETTDTTALFTDLNLDSDPTFAVFAVDSTGLHSDTASWTFDVFGFSILGQGLTDEDGDAFWTQYQVLWCPQFTSGPTISLRLIFALQTTYGSNPEILDSTELISRNPGATDTLDFLIPPQTKNYYDIRAELHDADGAILVDIPYDSIASLTEIGLEDLDGFHAWFDDAWTDNAVDTLPPSGYYESIDLWWDVDAYPDAGRVKVVIYERNSAGVESNFFESQLYDVAGFGSNDIFGISITAGTTVDVYDYRLRLLDQFNNLLDEINYGDDPDLMDIPLGIGTGIHAYNVPQMISSKH